MRKLKSLLAIVLVIACLMGFAVTASAADYTDDAVDATTIWVSSTNKKESVYARPMFDTNKFLFWAQMKYADGTRIEKPSNLTDIYAIDGKIYLLDGGTSRIIVMDEDYTVLKEIKEITLLDGSKAKFYGARGVLVEKDGTMYISHTGGITTTDDSEDAETDEEVTAAQDTQNTEGHVYITDNNGKALCEPLVKPESEMWPEDLHFKPEKVVRDKLGYIYILCTGSFYGAAMYKPVETASGTPNYEFKGFFGANVTTTNALEAVNNIWNMLFTNAEKLARSRQKLPFTFVDMELGADGYLYTCTGTTGSENTAKGAIRRLNPTGKNILIDKSTGEAVNSSDLIFGTEETVKDKGKVMAHDMRSITIDANNYIYILDIKYGKIYMYDVECNMLNSFGGGMQESTQSGTFRNAVALTSMNGTIYVIDSKKTGIVSFTINEYGKMVQQAQTLTMNGDYEKAMPIWEEVLKLDRNSMVAYRGLAKAYLLEGDYEKAMEYARLGFDRATYSSAYEYVRQGFLEKHFTLIFIGAIILVLAVVLLLKYKKKKNIKFIRNKKLKIALGTLLHPADTFYEIKRNNNGSVLIATLIIVVWYIFKIIGMSSGFIFNTSDINDVNAWYALAQTFGLVFLFVLSNWLVCVLFEGKGKLKQIYVATCYALIPMVIQAIGYDILSNVLTLGEAQFLTILNYVCIVLTAVYLVMAIINIQEFTFGKFVFTTIVTLLAMILIIFLIFLVSILVQEAANFIKTAAMEVLYR